MSVSLLPLALAAMISEPTSSAELPTYRDVGLHWVRGPSIRDMARHHRVSTTGFPFRGTAEVSCMADPRGRLDCAVLDEWPEDRGYGRAALRVMRPVRVAADDGYSPEGRAFGFRLRFGNWPVNELPDTYHPTDQNLRWTARPEMLGWTPQGLAVGQEVRATVNCTAKADGALDCTAADGDARLMQAALHSMGTARVERTDQATLEGSPLRWTFRIVNQAHCGGGGVGYGVPDSAKGAISGSPTDSTPTSDPLGPLTSIGGSYNGGTGSGSCLGSVVQMAGAPPEDH